MRYLSLKGRVMRKTSQAKRGKRNPINVLLLVLLIALVAYGVYRVFFNKPNTDFGVTEKELVISQNFQEETEKIKTTLKSFTGEEFKKLYNDFAYPNTQYISENSLITGNQEVDLYIQNFAESKGYKRRSAPVVDVFKTVQTGIVLQERAYQPWINLKTAAKKESFGLYLTAGYRSQAEQRELFMQRFSVSSVNYPRLLTGAYDNQLRDVLSTTAIPGYSRHHNGYTIDVGCEGESQAFEYTSCFGWLSRNNYENAKKYGWIPSYPEEADIQGPLPESWEYVWVSIDTVYE